MNAIAELRPHGTGRRLWEHEIKQLMAACIHFRYPARNEMVLLLAVDTGLTLNEIARLKRANVMVLGDYAPVVNVEGRVPRRLLMSERLFDATSRTVWGVAGGPEDPLVLPERGEDEGLHMTAKSVMRVLYRLFDKVGLIGVNAASCRRTFIENALATRDKAGASLQDVLAIAGLRSIRSLAPYSRGEADIESQKRLMGILMAGAAALRPRTTLNQVDAGSPLLRSERPARTGLSS